MKRSLAQRLVLSGVLGIVCAGWSQSEEKAPAEAYQKLIADPSKSTALAAFLDVWLDGDGFDRLRQHLKKQSENKRLTTDELRALAAVWSQLGDDDQALALATRAAEKKDAPPIAWLERARAEARLQRFKEAAASLDHITDDADAGIVRQAMELRTSIARHQGNSEQMSAKLRSLAAAKPDDTEIQMMFARWEIERGSRTRLIPLLKQHVADEKDNTARESWRQLLIEAQQYDGKNEDLVRTAIDGVLASQSDGEAEADYIGAIASVFHQCRFEAFVNPSPAEVAKTLADRPSAVQSMAAVMKSRGETTAALEAIAQLAKARPDDAGLPFMWAGELADAGRFDEAVNVLKEHVKKKPDGDSALVRMAMILREAGRNAEGAKVLQDWAVTPKPDEARVRKAAALLPLFLPDAEAKKWTDLAVKNLPARNFVEIRKGEAAEAEPPEIKQIKESDDDPKRKIERLLELRRQKPGSHAVASAVIVAFGQAGREAEAWHAMLSHHDTCKTPAAVRGWWRSGFADRNADRSMDPQRVLARLQALRRERSGDVRYWIALAEVARLSGDVSTQMTALTEVLRLAPGDDTARLSLAEAIADSGHPSEAARAVMPLMATPFAAKARLFLTSLHLKPGGIAQAGRTLAEVIDDPALDGSEVEDIAMRFMGWQEWRTAAAFLAAQRMLHPKNYRLACLHGLALKNLGARDEAIEVFLSMGGFHEEMKRDAGRSEMMRRYFGHDEIPQQAAQEDMTAAWSNIGRFVSMTLRERELLRSVIQERRSRSSGEAFMLAPMQLGECGPRAMAHLLDLARNLDANAKAVLAERARAAGLPLPEALIIGRLDGAGQNASLTPDESALSARLTEPPMAKLWVMQRRFARDRQGKETKLSEDELKLMRQCFATLLAGDVTTAMYAALQWWRNDAASDEAIAAVVQCVQKCEGDRFDALSALSEVMRALPPDICREPKRMSALLDALLEWRKRASGKDDEATARATYTIAPCLAAMGRWQDMAVILDEAATAAAKMKSQQQTSATRVRNYDGEGSGGAIPRWAYLQSTSPLVWPLEAAGGQNQSLFALLPRLPGGDEYRTGVPEEDRVSFLAAGKVIKDHQLRLSWAMAARDEKQTLAAAREWAKAEPANANAALLVACIDAREDHQDRALDRLHALIQTQKDEDSRRAAQVLYLRAVFFAAGQQPFNSEGRIVPRAPAKAQEKRIAAILRELHPSLLPLKTQLGDTWSALYAAAGLKTEAETMTVGREQRNRSYGPWQQEDRDFFERLSMRWNRRRHEERIAPNQIERLSKDVPRERVVTLCLAALRMEADELFLAETQRGQNIEEWQRAVTAQDITADLMKAADPGQGRTFRQLVHAMHVATVCSDARAAVAFGEEALKLQPGASAVETAVFQARQRAGGDAAEAVAFFKDRAPAEAREQISRLLNAAQSSSDTSQRLKLAEAVVKLAAEKPDIIGTDLAQRSGSRILDATFRLLTAPVRIREGEVPPLFPDFARSESGKEKPNPEGRDELATRKRLHGELCDLALKHPEWADEALDDLTIRHLTEDKPTAAELTACFSAAVKDRGAQKSWLFENWMRKGTEWRKTAYRLKLARLGLKVLPGLHDVDDLRGGGFQQPPASLAQLIGDRTQEPGWAIPLYALWENPGNITKGSPIYTAEQISLNQERQEIFSELWKQTEKHERWLPQMLPHWAAYRLHGDTGKTEVLARMRKLKDVPGDPYVLRAVAQTAGESYMTQSHVALAEIMEALLRENKSLLDQPDAPRLIDQVMKLLSKGREHEIERPPLSASPEEAEKPERGAIPAAVQKRRQAVHASLQEIVGDRFPKTPEALFTRLENELRAGKDTAKTEKLLLVLAKTDRSKLEQALSQFVKRAEGQQKTVNNVHGYVGGVWELGLQVRWMEAALRIGRPLLSEENQRDRGNTEWFRLCVFILMRENKLANPPVPPAAGWDRGRDGSPRGSTRKLYASMPQQKKRDALVASALDLAMKHPALRAEHFDDFICTRMAMEPPDTKAVLEILATLVKERPDAAASALNTWLTYQDDGVSHAQVMATAALIEKFVATWPATERTSSTEWLNPARSVLLQRDSSNRLLKQLPLVPGAIMNPSGYHMDITLLTPGAKERHAAWVKIVDAAALKLSLAPQVFVNLARLHIEDAPDRVLDCTKLLLANNPDKLNWLFQLIYGEEQPAPLERRLHWGRLVLRAMPSVKPLITAGGSPPTWLGATLKFLHGTRPDYGSPSGGVVISPPTPELLHERDEIVAKLTEEMMGSPAIAIESLVPFARKQFQNGAPSDTVLDFLKKAASNDAARVSDQIRAWCDALFTAKADVRERLWAAQALVPLAEVWMAEHGPANAYWLDSAANLIARRDGADATINPDQQKMLDRLMDVTLKSPEATSRMIATYAMTMMDATKVTKRVLDLAAKNAAAAGKMMETWWSDGRLAYNRQNERAGEMAVKILESWPPTASQDSLTWTLRTLRNLGEPLTEQPYFRPDPYKDNPIPGPGNTTLKQSIGREILSLLVKRQAKFDWMTAAQLRFALASGRDATQQKNSIAPLFKDEHQRSEALAYVQRKLEVDVSAQKNPSFGSRSALRGVPPDPKVSETIDAVRCLLLAAAHAWLPEETTSPLLDRARTRLREIAMRRRANPNSSFYEDGELPGSQIETATELLKELAAPKDIPSATAKPVASKTGAASPDKELVILLPELLGERLDDGLRKGTSATRLGDDTRILLKSEPEKTAQALRSWAGRLSQSHRARSYIAAGDVALNLAEHWTAEMPPPDWLVQFARYWPSRQWLTEPGEKEPRSEDILASRKAEERILPKLRAALKKFPACQNLDYFPTISPSGEPFVRNDAEGEELATLALAHIKAHKQPSSAPRASLLPSVSFEFDPAREEVPLFADLGRTDAHLFLLEHAWKKGRESWLRSTVIPAINEGRWLSNPKMFDQLADLYFCDKKDFNRAAEVFAKECWRTGSRERGVGAMWILRVAKFRGLEIDAAKWAQTADVAGQMNDYSGRAASAKLVVAWLAYRFETQKESKLDADLVAIMRAALGKEFPKRTDTIPLNEYSLRARDNQEFPSGSPPTFTDPVWTWLWETLTLAISLPECHGAALHLADITGVLADRLCGEQLFRATKHLDNVLPQERIKRILEANHFIDNASMPAHEWLMPVEGLSPIWSFGLRFNSVNRRETLKWLTDDASHRPTASKALLMLALDREKGDELDAARIASALSPCLRELKEQSRDRLAALSAALLVVQPRLVEAQPANHDVAALLKLLPAPAQEPAVEATARRWLTMKPDTIKQGDNLRLQLRALAYDLCRLLRGRSPQTDAVFEAATRLLMSIDWKARMPADVEQRRWVREQIVRSLVSVVRNFQTSRSYGNFDRETAGPSDDNRQSIPFLALRFIVHHEEDATIALSSWEFEELAQRMWQQRFATLRWDGKAAVEELLMTPATGALNHAALLQQAAFSKAAAQVPMTSLEKMATAATAAANMDQRHRPASWMLHCVFETQKQRRLGVAAADVALPAELIEEARALWKTKGLTLLSRGAIERLAPAAIPATDGSIRLDDWTHRTLMTRPWSDGTGTEYWYVGGDFRWLGSMRDKPSLEKQLAAAADALIQCLSTSKIRAIYTAPNSAGTIHSCLISPLASALDELGDRERRKTLVAAALTNRHLPYHAILDELRRDFATTLASVVPSYFSESLTSQKGAIPYSFTDEPPFTREDEKALEKLREAKEQAPHLVAIGLVRSVMADSASSPPLATRNARMTALVKEIADAPQLNEKALDALIARRGVAETLLPELLPVLRLHSFVTTWNDGGMKSIPPAEQNLGHRARTLSLWALAETLHGGKPDMWKKLMTAFKSRTEEDKAARLKREQDMGRTFRGIPEYALGWNEKVWQVEANGVIAHVIEWWLDHRPSADWPQLVQPLVETIAIGPDAAPTRIAGDLSFILHRKLPSFSTQPLDDASRLNPSTRAPNDIDLWKKIGSLMVPAAERWRRLAAWRDASNSAPIGASDAFLENAAAKHLLNPDEFATVVDTAPIETLQLRPCTLADWLIAADKNDDAIRLIRRLVTDPPKSGPEEPWLMLAATARDLGENELADRLRGIGEQLRLGRTISRAPSRRLSSGN